VKGRENIAHRVIYKVGGEKKKYCRQFSLIVVVMVMVMNWHHKFFINYYWMRLV
jgi:hypothetical protein